MLPERAMMAAVIAAGVVHIDTSRHENPAAVAKLALAITDQILEQCWKNLAKEKIAAARPAEQSGTEEPKNDHTT